MLYKIGKYSFCILSLCISFFQPSNQLEQIKISFWNPLDLSRYFLLISPPCVWEHDSYSHFSLRLSQLLAPSSSLLTGPLSLSLYLISCPPISFLKGQRACPKSHFSSQILPKGTSCPLLASLDAPRLNVRRMESQVSVTCQSELSEGLGAPPSQLTLRWTKASAALTHSSSP